jgi:hypothetical protein
MGKLALPFAAKGSINWCEFDFGGVILMFSNVKLAY